MFCTRESPLHFSKHAVSAVSVVCDGDDPLLPDPELGVGDHDRHDHDQPDHGRAQGVDDEGLLKVLLRVLRSRQRGGKEQENGCVCVEYTG